MQKTIAKATHLLLQLFKLDLGVERSLQVDEFHHQLL
jgi:hypothetical protein